MENRIRTLAVDDEPLALKQLATYIKNRLNGQMYS